MKKVFKYSKTHIIVSALILSTSANAITTSVSYVAKRWEFMQRNYHFGKDEGPRPGVRSTPFYDEGVNVSLEQNFSKYIVGAESEFTHYSNEGYLKLGYILENEDASITPSLLGIYVDHHDAGRSIAKKWGIGVQAKAIFKINDVFDFMITPRIKETYFTQFEADIGMRLSPFNNKNYKIISSITLSANPSSEVDTIRLQSVWAFKLGLQAKF